MRPAGTPGTRRRLLLPAAILILAGLAAGCSSSSKPAYCTDAANLKASVQNLGNADVATNGLSSLQTALSSVKTSAAAFAADAKSAYSSQTAALSISLSALGTAITSAKGQPPVTAAARSRQPSLKSRTQPARCKMPHQANASEECAKDASGRAPAPPRRPPSGSVYVAFTIT